MKSVKKACLIGINYNGTSAQLNGCVNDVFKLKKILIDKLSLWVNIFYN